MAGFHGDIGHRVAIYIQPFRANQGPFCFSVVLALVLGTFSFMSKSCRSVRAARSEAKHPLLVSVGELSA